MSILSAISRPEEDDASPDYRPLFGPPEMLPNPAPHEAIRDPLGRDSHLWDRERPDPQQGARLEAARQDWMGGASLRRLFDGQEFDLHGGVGRDQQNRPGDVFKVQALLHREGHLDMEPTGGPTGFWGSFQHEGVQAFQKEHGLTVDGYLEPGGETISRLKQLYNEDATGATTPGIGAADAAAPVSKPPVPDASVAALAPGQLVTPGAVAGSDPAEAAPDPAASDPAGSSQADSETQPPDQIAQADKRGPQQGATAAPAQAWKPKGKNAAMKLDIAQEESSLDPGIKNPNGAIGLFQFTRIAQKQIGLRDENGKWNPKNSFNVKSEEEILKSPDIQEAAFDAYMDSQWKQLKTIGAFDYLGKTVRGIKDTFPITEAGLLAAAHRVGPDEVLKYLKHMNSAGWVRNIKNPGDKQEKKYSWAETRLRIYSADKYRYER